MALGSDYDVALTMLHNETELNEPEVSMAWEFFAAACCTLIYCISLPGNSFLLWVLLKERAWRTTCDIFLLQLTVSNLCFTLTLPFMASNAIESWVFGGWVCGTMRWMFSMGMNSYVLILTAMVLHSYITVVHASRLSAQASSKRCVLVGSIVIWLTCAAASINYSAASTVIDFDPAIICAGTESLHELIVNTLLDITFFFVLPFMIITFCYVHMWITIKQGKINRQDQPSKLILGITFGHFLCMAPYTIVVFIDMMEFMELFNGGNAMKLAFLYAMFLFFPLSHLYCCVNPLFHILGRQRFRRHLPAPCNRGGDGINNDTVALISLQETLE